MQESNSRMKFYLQSFGGGILGTMPLILIFVFVTLPMFSERTMFYKSEGVSIAVGSVFEILTYFHKKAQAGELTEENAKKAALDLIKTLRYHGGEYFWINDTQPRMIMHPIKPELDGQELSDYKDSSGKLLFVEIAKTVQQNAKGEGFIDYHWAKPGSTDPVPKVSHVKLFKPWGWIVGNGVYVDDVIASSAEVRNKNIQYLAAALFFLIMTNAFLAFRQIQKHVIPVQSVIHKLTEESQTLAGSASQLSSAAGDLRQGSFEQESAVTEISSSMAEISSMIQSNVDMSRKSSIVATDTAHLSQRGLSAVSAVAEALETIDQANESSVSTFDELNKKIQDVNEAMSEIAAKAQIINDIVFQTKILSFNASVEAARAGEHGKGFSVVAEEVGLLAARSGESAHEIAKILSQSKELVNTLVRDSNERIGAVSQRARQSIDAGKTAIHECQSLLNEVAQKASQSSEMTQSILLAYEEQAKGADEVGKGVLLISQRTSKNLENAEHVTSFTEDIEGSAKVLADAVSRLGLSVGGRSDTQAA